MPRDEGEEEKEEMGGRWTGDHVHDTCQINERMWQLGWLNMRRDRGKGKGMRKGQAGTWAGPYYWAEASSLFFFFAFSFVLNPVH